MEATAEQLLAVLRARCGAPAVKFTSPPERLTGGFWAELWALSLAQQPAEWPPKVVVRIMPEPVVAAKETAIQSAAAAAGVPTPIVRCAGSPADGFGRPYLVMDRAEGAPLLAGLEGGAGIARAPGALWRMPDRLARVMATLHAVDPAPVRDRLAPLDGVATTIPELVEILRILSAIVDRADLEEAAGWLLSNPRAPKGTVICHGDLHPFNVLMDGEGRVTLLDWSASLLGPPAYDVAFTSLVLSNPPIAVPRAARPALRLAGRRLSARFVRRYRQYASATVDAADVLWYQAVVALRSLVEVAQWVDAGTLESHGQHPWLLAGDAFAARIHATTGVRVRAR